ncbi:ArsR/SmtB family transcription factor [Streptomyces sp. NPDC050485]|uniref:ArsR/SmtB family transcription factor n=1 Tax=Streptomyces sp. NPDC050485 TaxID=3365617 RepID=UPI003793DB34
MMTSANADLIRVIADPLRLQIVTLLAHETLCTSHLVEETGARQTNLSNHLRVLREAGVVETEPCGRFTYYKLKPEVIEALAESFGDLAVTARTTVETNRKRAC